MITDQCPCCQEAYEWDQEADCYVGCEVREVYDTQRRVKDDITGQTVELYLCPCGGVVAVGVGDKFGYQVYTPSTKEL